jgi:hypothetical protein
VPQQRNRSPRSSAAPQTAEDNYGSVPQLAGGVYGSAPKPREEPAAAYGSVPAPKEPMSQYGAPQKRFLVFFF